MLKKIRIITKLPVLQYIRTMHFHAHITFTLIAVSAPAHPHEAPGIHKVHVEYDIKEAMEHAYDYNKKIIRRKYSFIEKILIYS